MDVARTPNMDELASRGEVGLTQNTPIGMSPGSDVANLSIFGYNPEIYYTGRAPIEAVSQGLEIGKNDIVFRVNFVTIEDGFMKDFTADHILSEVAKRNIKLLNDNLGESFPQVTFYPGVSYRNLMVLRECRSSFETTPPHDIIGKKIDSYGPKGDLAEMIESIMIESQKILRDTDDKSSMVWLWGEGTKVSLPSFSEQTGLAAGVITAVDLLKGIGLSSGMRFIDVPGVTGFIDTNFKGKGQYCLEALKKLDVVFLHVEAADEAGHMGDARLKVEAIEKMDKEVLGTIIDNNPFEDLSILILPDHPTPVETRTHSIDLVPYLIYRTKGVQNKSDLLFNEKNAALSGKVVSNGHQLLATFLKE
jgi:2,3-bisphosphoglycerate-independent phosphoglycerate mutase